MKTLHIHIYIYIYIYTYIGYGLLVYQYDEVKFSNCSFFNQLQMQIESVSGFIKFLSSQFTNSVLLEISYSNFTEFTKLFKYHDLIMHSLIHVHSQNKQNFNATFSHLMFFNNTGNTTSCIYAYLAGTSASLQITNSIFKQNDIGSTIAIFAEQVSSFNLLLTENQFLNNSGTNIDIDCPIVSTVVIEKSQFIQTLNTKLIATDYGIAIYGCNNVLMQNLQVQLQNVKTSVKISGLRNALQLLANLEISNSNFTGNKNSPTFQQFTLKLIYWMVFLAYQTATSPTIPMVFQ